jgi:tRNA (guanine-N7-)-methyltransferase
VPFHAQALDLAALFGRSAPVVLEIGSGMGDTTAAIAQAHPDTDYLAIEVHTPGIGSLLKHLGERALTNVRVIQHDAVEVLREMIPAGSLAGIHIFFPDPWPKKRHHKRRILQPEFAALLASRLAPGGYVHFATDWVEYADHALAALAATPGLRNAGDGFVERPATRPETKFERRGIRLGHTVRDLYFLKDPK